MQDIHCWTGMTLMNLRKWQKKIENDNNTQQDATPSEHSVLERRQVLHQLKSMEKQDNITTTSEHSVLETGQVLHQLNCRTRQHNDDK